MKHLGTVLCEWCGNNEATSFDDENLCDNCERIRKEKEEALEVLS